MAEDLDRAEGIGALGGSGRKRVALRLGGAALAVAAGLGALWVSRIPIADHFIAQALREKGVPARYVITRIGPHTQRLEQLVLGDPRHPDLTARWIEVDLGYSLSGVRVTALRANGVRIAAHYGKDGLDFGSIERLLPKSAGKAQLPDITAELRDVRARLAMAGGAVDLLLDGAGNLRSGFAGRMAAATPHLALAGCAADRLTARMAVASEGGKLHVKGPLNAARIACAGSGFSIDALGIDADWLSDPALEDMSGALALSAGSGRLRARVATHLSGLITFKGSADVLEGSASLAADRTALSFAGTGTVKIGGRFAARPKPRDLDYSVSGTVTAEALRPASPSAFDRVAAAAAGTPLDPLARKLAGALRAATQANRLTLGARVTGAGSQMQVLVNAVHFAAASGAKADLTPDGRFTLNLPKNDWTLDGAITTGGGGLPEARLVVAPAGPGGLLHGVLSVRDYRASGARLGLTPVRFAHRAEGGFAVSTAVSLDGPMGDGAVRGLTVPVSGLVGTDGSIRLANECLPVRWQALRIANASFDPAQLRLCGAGGAILRLDAATLRGRIGESPLALAVQSARYGVRNGAFGLTGLDAQIGAGANPVSLQAVSLSGIRAADGVIAGTVSGGHAVIGTVPLDQSNIAGRWRFADGALTLDGAMRVADREQDARFSPLDVPNAQFLLAGGRITAGGTLVNPRSGVAVAKVSVDHDLGSGEGAASFAIDRLNFGPAIQPDDLTRLSQGIVQLVEGPVEGRGAIRWSASGVTGSSATFSTQDLNFAGAFGPVRGFSTSIEFVDLLGLRTAPHQRLTVRQVSAGVDVFDGTIDYALLSSQRAQIEGGRWPFAGGTLELLPAPLNLDAREPRHVTFRVTGLDAAAFVNTLQLKNLDVQGTLDGLLPMTFDANGGRIDGGVLVARQAGLPPLVLASAADAIPACDSQRAGGSLAYVGPVSNAELGTMGKFAFDALKHFGYRCLVVRLDGALDGEFVTQVRVSGLDQGAEGRHSWLVRPFLKLPIVFNVRIEAPFRKLLGIYTNIYDPGDIQQMLDDRKAAAANAPLAVQPADSEKGSEGKAK